MTRRAVIAVDIQNDYFDGGKFPLHGMDAAAANARKVIDAARVAGDLVIHVRHEFTDPAMPFFNPGTEGVRINDSVAPAEGETVLTKNHVNSFRDTDLKATLDAAEVDEVVIIGAMSHMCIDAATRAASDLGYRTTVIHDACATRDLEFGGRTVPAEQVHAAMMSALAFGYADVVGTEAWVKGA